MNNGVPKENCTSSAIKYRKRFGELAIGLLANELMVRAFDLILYPFVIYRYGILLGGVVMTGLSFIVCLLSVWFYDWSKHDWLGIEAIKSMKEYTGDRKFFRLIAWVLRKNDLLAMLILSLQFDPFITMVYLRRGAYNGMNGRDWKIFLASLIFSNAYWTLACFMGISLVEWILKMISVVLKFTY